MSQVNSEDLFRVLHHPGFVELSNWPDMEQPWAVGINFGTAPTRITWFRGETLPSVLMQTICGLEQFGISGTFSQKYPQDEACVING